MRKVLSFCMLVLSSASVHAQDAYFVKIGAGIGTSSSSFNILPGHPASNHTNIFSAQEQLSLGYTHGNLQFETGLGYLLTGLNYSIGPGGGGCVVGPNPNPNGNTSSANAGIYTIKNPHITVPAIVGYVLNGKNKFSVCPGVGIEALYNLKGKMTTTNESDAGSEKMDYSYNNISAAAVVKVDMQYKMGKHISIWVSPSYQNMISSLSTKVQGDAMSRIYDRAFLMNGGLKYNFLCPKHNADNSGANN